MAARFFIVCGSPSMRHDVEDNVDPERKSDVLGKPVEEIVVFAFAFPAVTVIRVVTRDDHQAASGVKDGLNMDLGTLLAIVVFPSDAVVLASSALPDVRDLQLVLRAVQLEDGVEHGVIHGQFRQLAFGFGSDGKPCAAGVQSTHRAMVSCD